MRDLLRVIALVSNDNISGFNMDVSVHETVRRTRLCNKMMLRASGLSFR